MENRRLSFLAEVGGPAGGDTFVSPTSSLQGLLQQLSGKGVNDWLEAFSDAGGESLKPGREENGLHEGDFLFSFLRGAGLFVTFYARNL